MRSGSIVVAGQGRFQATAVGAEAYATQLAAEARRFTLAHSELRAGTNRCCAGSRSSCSSSDRSCCGANSASTDNETWQDAVTGTVAALVGMVPEGLVLLTSLAFMVATVTLARRQTLVQELPAVEGLARVDVVCLDKTGTLTHGDIVYDRRAAPRQCRRARTSARRSRCPQRGPDANATSPGACKREFADPAWRRTGGVPFSSARKWSAVGAAGHGTWVLGGAGDGAAATHRRRRP